jgi:hypothetical protein
MSRKHEVDYSSCAHLNYVRKEKVITYLRCKFRMLSSVTEFQHNVDEKNIKELFNFCRFGIISNYIFVLYFLW